MSSKTKIVVLHMKEIIYTAIFAFFIILLIGLLYAMFRGESNPPTEQTNYIPGVYSSSVPLNDTSVSIEVSVDANRITSIRISNLTEQLDSLYPLLQPTIEDMATQIYLKQSLENISVSESNSHTASLLLKAIDESLKKAAVH